MYLYFILKLYALKVYGRLKYQTLHIDLQEEIFTLKDFSSSVSFGHLEDYWKVIHKKHSVIF